MGQVMYLQCNSSLASWEVEAFVRFSAGSFAYQL